MDGWRLTGMRASKKRPRRIEREVLGRIGDFPRTFFGRKTLRKRKQMSKKKKKKKKKKKNKRQKTKTTKKRGEKRRAKLHEPPAGRDEEVFSIRWAERSNTCNPRLKNCSKTHPSLLAGARLRHCPQPALFFCKFPG